MEVGEIPVVQSSVKRNICSVSTATSILCPCSHPETLQSFGALDLSYATLCSKINFQVNQLLAQFEKGEQSREKERTEYDTK